MLFVYFLCTDPPCVFIRRLHGFLQPSRLCTQFILISAFCDLKEAMERFFPVLLPHFLSKTGRKIRSLHFSDPRSLKDITADLLRLSWTTRDSTSSILFPTEIYLWMQCRVAQLTELIIPTVLSFTNHTPGLEPAQHLISRKAILLLI